MNEEEIFQVVKQVLEEEKSKMQTDAVIQELRDLIIESKRFKNGEWKTERALFEQRTVNELEDIKTLLEDLPFIHHAWFFKAINSFFKNKKFTLFFVLGGIVSINLIQYIPLVTLGKILIALIGIG